MKQEPTEATRRSSQGAAGIPVRKGGEDVSFSRVQTEGTSDRPRFLILAATLSSLLLALSAIPIAATAQQVLGAWTLSAYQADASPAADGINVDFHGGIDWPNLMLSREPPGTPENTLVVPVTNLSDAVEEVFLRLGDDAKATWPDHALAVTVRLLPGERTTLLVPFVAHNARLSGMQVGPPPSGAPSGPIKRLDQPTGKLDGARARTLVITLWGQTGARRLYIGTPQYANLGWDGAALDGLIDAYGQSTRGTWPEQVQSDAALKAKARSVLPSAQARPLEDGFGGVLASGPFSTTGYFHVEGSAQTGYQLVTPEGHGFFSLGVNTVGLGDGATYVSGREKMFLGLPPKSDKDVQGEGDDRSTNLATRQVSFDHGHWVNFYVANLKRLYGSKFLGGWREETLSRLLAWGFNTLGSWSDPVLMKGVRHVPYVVPIALKGNYGHLSSPFDFWGPLGDPFDPRFKNDVEASVALATEKTRDDPYVIGDFVENELPWGDASDVRVSHRYSLASAAFALGPTSAAKVALVDALRTRYGDIASFNAAWGLHVASWDALLSYPPALPDVQPAAALADLQSFSEALAERYYRIVREAIRLHDPHHLYLGSRFAALTPEALAACVRWCDVVSVNLYSERFDLARLGAIDKPILISEFSFGSQDRGPFWAGVVDVGREGERATHYRAFVIQAAHDPRVIGAHWFQYVDEPASGRLLDGENGHFGMVSIADVPFVTLTEEMRRTNAEAKKVRADMFAANP